MRTLFSYLLAILSMFLLFGGLFVGYGDALIAGSVLVGSMVVADSVRYRNDSVS